MPGTSSSGPGKGKTNNPKGRTAGTPNRTTKEAKEILEKLLYGQFEDIETALNQLKDEDPAKFIDAVTKLFGYVLPKKTDVTSGDEKIVISFKRD
jgi:hypothetical protein